LKKIKKNSKRIKEKRSKEQGAAGARSCRRRRKEGKQRSNGGRRRGVRRAEIFEVHPGNTTPYSIYFPAPPISDITGGYNRG